MLVKKAPIKISHLLYALFRIGVYIFLTYLIFKETGIFTAVTLLAFTIYIEVNSATISTIAATGKETNSLLDVILKWQRKKDIEQNGPEGLEENSVSNLRSS